MSSRFAGRLSYSNVMSTVAVFLAAGGGAYAAVNSTAARSRVIHACYRKSGGNLRIVAAAKKCRAGERSLAWNQRGPQGIPGIQGIPGANGTNGTNGADGATNLIVRSVSAPVAAGSDGGAIVSCNPGERAVGGGASVPANLTGPFVLEFSEPATNGAPSANGETPNGWGSAIQNNSGVTKSVSIYAVCASP